MSPSTKDEALAARPVVNEVVGVVTGDDGLIRLSYPPALPGWLVRLLPLARVKSLRRTLELDAMGTFVWGSIDGQRSVRQLAELVTERRRGWPPLSVSLAGAAFSGCARVAGDQSMPSPCRPLSPLFAKCCCSRATAVSMSFSARVARAWG
jgi:Coenzyme PQQ synthesis protein D (PqqD)